MQIQTIKNYTGQKSLTFETLKEKKNYVMQGNAREKALDTYHLILAPTYACNLRCKHCYLPNHEKVFLPKDIVLRLVDEWNEIVLEERGQYGGFFHIKGGEPFIVPYLWSIVDRLIKLQSICFMITTNGTFTKGDIFKRLRDCNNELDGHLTIIVSLDGAIEDTHTILRGKGQFIKTLKFLEELQNHGITFYLNCVVHMQNIHELSSYIELAKKYGAAQVNFLFFVPRGIGSGFCQFQLPHIEVYHQLETIYKNADEETKAMIEGSLPYIKYRETYKYYQPSHECVAAYRGMFYITPDGNVYTCPNIVFPEFSIGNVFRQHLKEISENLSTLYQRLKIYNKPYTCTGERILYKRNRDQSNQESLDRFQQNLVNLRKNTLGNLTKSNLKSYCFSKNW